MPAPCTTGVPRQREAGTPEENMSGEEAIAVYREWRARVIGDRDNRVHDMFDLLAEMREEPGF